MRFTQDRRIIRANAGVAVLRRHRVDAYLLVEIAHCALYTIFFATPAKCGPNSHQQYVRVTNMGGGGRGGKGLIK